MGLGEAGAWIFFRRIFLLYLKFINRNKVFASFLARRMSLIRADRRSLVGSVVAIAGVALAVCTMMLTVAVSRGFGREVTARLLAFDAPLTVSVPPIVEGESMVAVTPELREVINDVFCLGLRMWLYGRHRQW